MSEILGQTPPEETQKLGFDWKEAVTVIGSLASIYLITWAGFKREIKEEVWEKQGGVSPTGVPIDEFHHIVPEKALLGRGIKGKNCAENCVGLGFEEHKQKWDPLSRKMIFYPGVSLEELNPETYTVFESHRKNKQHRRRDRRHR